MKPIFQIERLIPLPANHDRGPITERQKIRGACGIPYEWETREAAEEAADRIREGLASLSIADPGEIEVIEVTDMEGTL